MNAPHRDVRLAVRGLDQILARGAAEVAQAFCLSVRMLRKWLAGFREGGHGRCRTAKILRAKRARACGGASAF
ncbi:hypothetical protein JMM63_13570 [Rhodovulum sulfidophilum]|uniref:Helix-turn-helix domain-containing protein n=1 Tax=Rhodovulum sulfidophilum TaxID=35806 RepID=A0ABS1RUE8_RHOSU|nr:hypothetical protein [Rhodovulum sulfidophilum]MBL3596583.1 hypothetical protein [Rhodovulum sulfidophilum]MBL3609720.1 hypothetical protein [Rhodovulum sulfidophilum]MCE8457705.1 hypothetical protein [Rhodovulum sulfidophilum]